LGDLADLKDLRGLIEKRLRFEENRPLNGWEKGYPDEDEMAPLFENLSSSPETARP
jgi:hypothetical protein